MVDFSIMKEEEQQMAALEEAKKLLIECGEYKNAETAKLREDAAKRGQQSTITSPKWLVAHSNKTTRMKTRQEFEA